MLLDIEGALASFLNLALGFSPTLFLQLPRSYILAWFQFFFYIYDKTSVYPKTYDRLLKGSQEKFISINLQRFHMNRPAHVPRQNPETISNISSKVKTKKLD